jgi:hypothetical protein
MLPIGAHGASSAALCATVVAGSRLGPVAQEGAPVLELPAPAAPPEDEDSAPYHRIAANLRGAIRVGALKPGDLLPTVVELGERYDVSPATAHRAVALLADGGEVAVSRGRRASAVG